MSTDGFYHKNFLKQIDIQILFQSDFYGKVNLIDRSTHPNMNYKH